MTGSETQGVKNAIDGADESKHSDQEVWGKVGFVRASSYRASTIGRLGEHPMTPSRIAELEEEDMTHTSRALSELRDEDLVHLLVPENQRKGRIYGLTALGHEVWRRIQNSGGVEA